MSEKIARMKRGGKPGTTAPSRAPRERGRGKVVTTRRRAVRKRGGQPRNTNARKHGFYSDTFTEDELTLVAAFVTDISLDDELWMQRVMNRRLMTDTQEADKDTLIRIAQALAVGTGRVAKLLRDKHVLSGKAADTIAAPVVARRDPSAKLISSCQIRPNAVAGGRTFTTPTTTEMTGLFLRLKKIYPLHAFLWEVWANTPTDRTLNHPDLIPIRRHIARLAQRYL